MYETARVEYAVFYRTSRRLRQLIAKFHYTDPTRTRHGPDPTRTKSAHIVGYELNSTTRTRHGPDTDKVRARCRVRAKFDYTDPIRTRHGPDRTRTDPHGLFLRRNSVGSVRVADKVRAGPVGSV